MGAALLFLCSAASSASVGYTPGAFEVDDSGAAVYSIPLQVPPGTNGMEPELSIDYHSHAGDGQLGLGWSLSGLSLVTRCPANHANDSFSGTIRFDANDRFCLDGQRLVAVAGTYGADGTEYRTEIETFSRVVSYGAAGNGPAWFQVWTRDGRILTYGATTDARILAQGRTEALVWAVNRVQDRHGNYWAAGYGADAQTGEWWLERIDYTGNDTAGLIPYAAVAFVYEPRPDVSRGWTGDSRHTRSRRIARIEVLHEGSLVREYRLQYLEDPGGVEASRLERVTECAGNGQCLAPTHFEWSSTNTGLTQQTVLSYSGVPPRFAELSGDGRPDLVRVNTNGSAQVWRNTGNGITGPATWTTGLQGRVLLGDVDGDGRDDLLQILNGSLTIHRSTGSGFRTLNSHSLSNWSDQADESWVLDVTGDGRNDLVQLQSGALRVWTSNGFALGHRGIWATLPAGCLPSSIEWHDFDGNGAKDAVCVSGEDVYLLLTDGNRFTAHGPFPLGPPATLMYGDFNGDGLVDALRFPHILETEGPLAVVPFKGTGFAGSQPQGYGFSYKSNHVLADIDGNGRKDLIEVRNGELRVWLATPGADLADQGTWGNYGGCRPDKTVDLYGDGKESLYCFKDGLLRVWRPTPAPAGLLTRVVDGLGHEAQFTYASAHDPGVHSSLSGAYPNVSLREPLQVVEELRASDGSDGSYELRYTYYGATYDAGRRVFTGIRQTTMDDSRTSIRTFISRKLEFPFTGQPVVQYMQSGSTILRLESNTWEVSAGFGFRPWARLREQYIQNRNPDGTGLSDVFQTRTYDNYGNTRQIATEHSGTLETYRMEEDYDHLIDASQWFLGLLISSRVTRTDANGNSVTHERSYMPDLLTGVLLAEEREPNRPEYRLLTEYGYDAFGNRDTVTVSGSGIETRASSQNHDARGRFVIERINPLGHRETLDYDGRFGVMTAQTGPNGLTTRWTHDPFGRRAKEIRPDGSLSNWLYNWCGVGATCPEQARYMMLTIQGGAPHRISYRDALDREVRTEQGGFDGRGIWQDSEYDTLGRLARVSRPYYEGGQPHWTRYRYDALDRILEEAHPNGVLLRVAYSGLAETVTRTDTAGSFQDITLRRHDVLGRLVEVIDGVGHTVRYRYDPVGNLLETDADGVVTSVAYDHLGRKSAMTDPDMGAWEYRHNVLGELTWQKNAKGQVTTMEYDRLGRMIRRMEPEGTSTWTYDTAQKGIGKLARSVGAGGDERTYWYDGVGRPWLMMSYISGTHYYSARYYDQYGRPDMLYYPSNLTIRQRYNAFGYLEAVEDNSANPGYVYWRTEEMDAEGNVTLETLGNGLQTVRLHDATSGLVTSISTGRGGASDVQYLTYDWDTRGNLAERRDYNQNLTETFVYDSLDRLEQATIAGIGARTYAYDARGNLTQRSNVGSYTYGENGAGPHAVTTAGGQTYSYDANGNMIGGAGRSITWNSFNKPVRIAKGSTIIDFGYDVEHRRVWQRRGDRSIVYVNDLGAVYERETRGNVVTHRNYIQAAGRTVALHVKKSNATDRVYYLHRDHLGSVDVVTDEAGDVIERHSFSPFGERRNPNWSDATGLLTSALLPRGFTDHEQLDEVGLVYVGARLYDPRLGRFLSPDPFVQAPANPQSINRYSYVMNNPLSATDPNGYFFKKAFKKVFRGIKKAFKSTVKAIKKAISNPVVQAVVVAAVTGNLVYAATKGLFIPGGVVTAKAAAGAAAGFSGGLVGSRGDVRTALRAAGAGAVSGTIFGVTDVWARDAGLGTAGSIAARSTAAGLSNEATGGKFRDGFETALVTDAGARVYERIVGYEATWKSGGEATEKLRYTPPLAGTNNIGIQWTNGEPNRLDKLFWEGGPVSRALNVVPGVNAVAGMHDVFQVQADVVGGNLLRNAVNLPGMPVAATITAPALLDPLLPYAYLNDIKR